MAASFSTSALDEDPLVATLAFLRHGFPWSPPSARNHFSEIGVRNRFRRITGYLSASPPPGRPCCTLLSGFFAVSFYLRGNSSEKRGKGKKANKESARASGTESKDRASPPLCLLRSFNPQQPRELLGNQPGHRSERDLPWRGGREKKSGSLQ